MGDGYGATFWLAIGQELEEGFWGFSLEPAGVRCTEINGSCAAAGRSRELRSRYLARSRHRLTQQHGGINDRYREGCSHPAWQATG